MYLRAIPQDVREEYQNRLLQPSNKLIFLFLSTNRSMFSSEKHPFSSWFPACDYFINWHTLPSILFGSHWKVRAKGATGRGFSATRHYL